MSASIVVCNLCTLSELGGLMLLFTQVVAFANTLRDAEGQLLVRSARVSGTTAPPRELPVIILLKM